MSDLSVAAAAMGVPEALVKRSAEARAKATGSTVDEVLAAWAGGAAPPAAPPVTAPPPAVSPAAASAPTAITAPSPAVSPATAVAPPPAASRPVEEAPIPREVSPREALRYPVVVTVPTSGLKERTAAGLPRWLAAAFLLVAVFGVLQLAGAPANDCGEGAELAVDRVSGRLLNCDGSPFEGRGEPGGGVDYGELGEQVYTGQVVAAANCAGCHGPQGQGGVGPAFATVVATFSSCLDHIEWVSKGTTGFQAEGRTNYGDLNKPVGGVGNMPAFGSTLTTEQIAAVVAFERVRFGGANPEQTFIDCGLVETPGEGAEGEAPAEGEGPSTTTNP